VKSRLLLDLRTKRAILGDLRGLEAYRTWVALLLGIMLEDEAHEIAGQAITRTLGR
jgi:hypothetical protein